MKLLGRQATRKREYNKRYYREHREKLLADARAWRRANPEHVRDYDLRRATGISLADKEKMNRDGKCWICGDAPKVLEVDHDHFTGVVRGLLCHHCNVGIGHFKDDPEMLRRAMKYLTKESRNELVG